MMFEGEALLKYFYSNKIIKVCNALLLLAVLLSSGLQKLTIAFLSYINVIIYNIIQTSWYVFICLFSDDFAATIFKSC